MGEPKSISKNWFGYACGASYVQYDDAVAETQYDLSSDKGLATDDTYDSSEFPFGTSHLSSEDFHREMGASLPFEFDLGPEASGRKSEKYLTRG